MGRTKYSNAANVAPSWKEAHGMVPRVGINLASANSAEAESSTRSTAKARLRPVVLDKARTKLEELALSLQESHRGSVSLNGTQKAAFLVLPGYFNPVNVAHLAALERAVARVARGGVPVIAGFLAPAQDIGTESLGAAALSFTQRTALCSLACVESDWLDVCSWGWCNMTRTTQRIAQQLSDRLAWTGGLHWDFEAWCVVGNSVRLHRHLRDCPGIPSGRQARSCPDCSWKSCCQKHGTLHRRCPSPGLRRRLAASCTAGAQSASRAA
ncbi:unnamed protein product [Polarella glacialis]|uniref:Cytidyltransferase-like domain-containing protein n=1 Tax=Polarella glacialis TaxID=89957 RepID=A0A813K5N1_POLGL|nr:unnamed protein product [Polarella glacialis]